MWLNLKEGEFLSFRDKVVLLNGLFAFSLHRCWIMLAWHYLFRKVCMCAKSLRKSSRYMPKIQMYACVWMCTETPGTQWSWPSGETPQNKVNNKELNRVQKTQDSCFINDSIAPSNSTEKPQDSAHHKTIEIWHTVHTAALANV